MGEYQELQAVWESQHGVFLGDEDEEVLLPRGQCPTGLKRGDTLRVFLYTDSLDRPIATLKKPLAVAGEFAKLAVVSVTGAGAFLDWGLDKDLFCPIKEQQAPMRVGQSYVVRVYDDEVSDRVVCSSKLGKFLQASGEGLRPGQQVRIMVAEKTHEMFVVIIDGAIKGSLFSDEWHEDLHVGDVRDAFVKQVRASDGKVAVSLRPQGFNAVLGERDRLLNALRTAGGSLPVSDKSSPEEIQRRFGLSKGAFKKLIGALYRERVIEIEPKAIRLVQDQKKR